MIRRVAAIVIGVCLVLSLVGCTQGERVRRASANAAVVSAPVDADGSGSLEGLILGAGEREVTESPLKMEYSVDIEWEGAKGDAVQSSFVVTDETVVLVDGTELTAAGARSAIAKVDEANQGVTASTLAKVDYVLSSGGSGDSALEESAVSRIATRIELASQ